MGKTEAATGTLVAILRARAAESPDKIAFTFVAEGETYDRTITYSELDRRARAIASKLLQSGAAGQPVLLLFGSSLEYVEAFYGCLYAGAIAVPAYPPDPRRVSQSLPRLMSIISDCRPKVGLTIRGLLPLVSTVKMQARLAPLASKVTPSSSGMKQSLDDLGALDIAPLNEMKWLPVDRIKDREAEGWEAPTLRPDDVAYLQYTSGSTSDPKGVVIRHKNALVNLKLASELLGTTDRDVAVGWVPLYHDLGLVCHVLGGPYASMHCVLMSPLDFLKRPAFWLEMISKYRGSFNAGPNFAYELCVKKTNEEQRARLDLSCWRVAGNGGEPVRSETLQRFNAAFEGSGFSASTHFPTFGLAEATLFVSVGKEQGTAPREMNIKASDLEEGRVALASEDDRAVNLVSCGKTAPDHELLIVDPKNWEPLREGEIGEVWFAGESVPDSYWGRPIQSQETFAAAPRGAKEGFLKTGDLGFLYEGELYVTGRIKDLIIVRGRNHYPQDVEATSQRQSDLFRPGCGAAFSLAEDEAVVLVQELRGEASPQELSQLASQVRESVRAEHELLVDEVIFARPRSLPKTSSGKIQRRRCRALFLDQQLEELGRFSLGLSAQGEN